MPLFRQSNVASMAPVSQKDVEKEFQTIFGHLDSDIKLLSYYSCDYHEESDELIYKGRIYITQKFLCFYSPPKNFQKTIPFSDVINIVKKNTALVFANAIGVMHSYGSEFFTSFNNRDKVFEELTQRWNKRKVSNTSYESNAIKQESKAIKPNPAGNTESDQLFELDEENFEEPVPEMLEITTPGQADRMRHTINLPTSSLREQNNDVTMENAKEKNLVNHLRRTGSPKRERSLSDKRQQVENEKVNQKPLNASESSVKIPAEQTMRRSFASKDDLTIHWEHGEKPKTQEKLSNEEGLSETKQEKKEEPEEVEEEIERPKGVFRDHIVIKTPPAVSTRFKGISCLQMYKDLIYCKPFWEYVLEEQENKDGFISELKPSVNHPENVFERELRFVTPIKGAPMGPKETRVEQSQRVSMPSESEIIIDSTSKSLDIPVYGDAFVVQTLWNFKNDGEDCQLHIRWKVHFLKSVWVKGLIEKNAKTATEEALISWIDLAKKWLQKGKGQVTLRSSSTLENKAIMRKVSSEDIVPIPKASEPVDSTALMNNETGILDTTLNLPIVDVPVAMRFVLLITVGFAFLICSGVLLSHIQNVEYEVVLWKESVQDLTDRLVFLQIFSSYLLEHVSGQENSILEEWEYWKQTRGLDWRLAEWQDQMFVLEEKLSEALGEVSRVLEMVSDPQPWDQHGLDRLLNERRLKSLISFVDTSKPTLATVQESSFIWGVFLMCVVFVLVLVSGYYFYSRGQ